MMTALLYAGDSVMVWAVLLLLRSGLPLLASLLAITLLKGLDVLWRERLLKVGLLLSVVSVALLFLMPSWSLWCLPLPVEGLPQLDTSLNVPLMAVPMAGGDYVTAARASLAVWTVGIYLLGVVILLARLMLGAWHLARLNRTATPLSDQELVLFREMADRVGLNRLLRIVVSERVEGPMVFGLWRPLFLLPQDWSQRYDTPRLTMIALHEFTHLRRRDNLLLTLLSTFRALFWVQPLFWLTESLLRNAIELTCDHETVRLTGERTAYARLLTDEALERRSAQGGAVALPFSLHGRSHALKQRITHLLTVPAGSRSKGLRRGLSTVLLASLFLLSLSTEAITREQDRDFQPRLPLKEANITAKFGPMINPFTKKEMMHEGVDLRAPEGTPIYAAEAGSVVISELKGAYGEHVMLKHGEHFTTFYSHMSKRLVEVGQEVQKGQVIGKVGSTGRSTGPHLHFAIRHDDVPVDPMSMISISGVQ